MKTQDFTATAIVNVSPIEWGHFLLVAELESALKQRLTCDTIRLGIETINLFQNPYMRLMFNSLLAWASVNHFHYHCICYPAELILDNISLEPFHKELKVISSCYPIRALVTEIKPEESEIKEKSKLLEKVINTLYEMDIAHNVVITRSKENVTRFYIFPRVKADTSIVSQCVDPACVEFSGQFPCKDEESWLGYNIQFNSLRKLDFDMALKLLGSVKLDEALEAALFDRLKASL